MPINIFASYRGRSKEFVRQFLEIYVGNYRTAFTVFNWTGPGRVLPGMELDSKLRQEIEKADIFLAFIDGDYGEGITQSELDYAIERSQRRRGWPCIVPLPLDIQGEAFVEPLIAEGGPLAGVTYEPCFNAEGKRYPSEDARFGDWIVALSDSHRKERSTAPATAAVVPVEPTGVVLLDRGSTEEEPDDGQARTGGNVAAEAVAAFLRESGVPALHAPPGWENAGDPGIGLFADPHPAVVYVQVLSAPLIRPFLRFPALLKRRLQPLVAGEGLDRSRVAYWLPGDQAAVPEFDERVADEAEGNPGFRNDTPAGMTEWLTGLLGLGLPEPVAAYQDVEGERGQQAMLRDRVNALVGPGMPQRLEDRELYPYCMDALQDVVFSLAKRRPILITHNINANAPLASPNAVRIATLQQLSDVTRRADQALQRKGVGTDDVFWLSILQKGNPFTQNAVDYIPTSGEFRLNRWCVLEYGRTGDGWDFETGRRRDKVTKALVKWGAGN